MTKKIFRSIIAVAITVLLASLIIASDFLYEYFNKTQTNRLKEELALVSTSVDRDGISYFDNFNSSVFRFTLISSNGSVLYDSAAKPEEMENHLDREEISSALKNGSGSSTRYSSTLTERTFYEAVRLENGNILRISVTQVTVGALIIGMSPAICAILVFAVIIAIVLSQKMAKSIVKPLETLDLEHPDNNNTYEELTPILSKLNKQHIQIKNQVNAIKQKNDEFKQITDCMSEGLILLDKDGNILSINNTAKTLFGLTDDFLGVDFSKVEHLSEMTTAVEKSQIGNHSEFRKEINGKEYQFMISPIVSSEKVIGSAVLCIDVTETAFAERNRKEFTANVSHELKTPLQSIIGSAELLENGLVKPQDTEKFISNIKFEAVRLVELINDIIRLSQLDEENAIQKENVDLYEVAKEVVETLRTSAAKNQVEILLEGKNLTISGIRHYLYEIIYNLCDNAIRYNKKGGKVNIEVKKENEKPIVKISDTGIGIPPEHQSRIFERFYRVDKSHSKETGGTGLGLSIVKHAVTIHGGSIKLFSRQGKGTTVTVLF